MVNKAVVKRKLIKLKQYLGELETLDHTTYEEYTENFLIRRTVERLVQLLVDSATDINTHILVDNNLPPPPDAYTSFIQLAKSGVITRELSVEIAPSTGERNVLVHEYESINDLIVYQSIPVAIKLFKRYCRQVEKFLDNLK
jgi:uncharacterized protein YutE (UPF0331/DUF86 family)